MYQSNLYGIEITWGQQEAIDEKVSIEPLWNWNQFVHIESCLQSLYQSDLYGIEILVSALHSCAAVVYQSNLLFIMFCSPFWGLFLWGCHVVRHEVLWTYDMRCYSCTTWGCIVVRHDIRYLSDSLSHACFMNQNERRVNIYEREANNCVRIDNNHYVIKDGYKTFTIEKTVRIVRTHSIYSRL